MNNPDHDKQDDQFNSLLETVERLRKDQYPHLDPVLVRELLRLHADGSADDKDLSRDVEQAVEHRLAAEI